VLGLLTLNTFYGSKLIINYICMFCRFRNGDADVEIIFPERNGPLPGRSDGRSPAYRNHLLRQIRRHKTGGALCCVYFCFSSEPISLFVRTTIFYIWQFRTVYLNYIPRDWPSPLYRVFIYYIKWALRVVWSRRTKAMWKRLTIIVYRDSDIMWPNRV